MIKTADLPKLIARLAATKDDREAAALDKAMREVCLRSKDREDVAAQLAAALPTASEPVKARILQTLNVVGRATALEAVAAAAKSSDEGLRDAAFRVLGHWKSVDAAPVLLELHNTLGDERLKIRAMRAYIRIARQFDMPAVRRAAMCRTALKTAVRDEDKRLVLEVLLRYPSEEMQSIAQQAAKVPALKEEASLVLMGMTSKGINRARTRQSIGPSRSQTGKTGNHQGRVRRRRENQRRYCASAQIRQKLPHYLPTQCKLQRELCRRPGSRYRKAVKDPVQYRRQTRKSLPERKRHYSTANAEIERTLSCSISNPRPEIPGNLDMVATQ